MSTAPSTLFKLARRLLLAPAILGCVAAQGYEADVHFGLTLWLALKAGFESPEAHAIAIGNLRADSGLIDTLEVNLEYACVGTFAEAANEVRRRHYPGAALGSKDAQVGQVVSPGGLASRQPLRDIMASTEGKESLLLSKFGEALHTLQDSWSHAGVPGVATPGGGLVCDPALFSGHPASREGPESHAADLTHLHPGDLEEMARATFDALNAYPRVREKAREPAAWRDLSEPVLRFARGRTKTEKREWFVAQGMDDTRFLAGISLPDGPRPGTLQILGRQLPPLKSSASSQHDVPTDAKQFFDALFAHWLSSEPVESMVLALADVDLPPATSKSAAREATAMHEARMRQLLAQLKLWKMRDHGTAGRLLHGQNQLSAAQLKEVDRLAKRKDAFVLPTSPQLAFVPLLAKGEHASPLLPYVLRKLPDASTATRMIAIVRLQHAPYDSLGFIAQRVRDRWVLIDVASTIDQ